MAQEEIKPMELSEFKGTELQTPGTIINLPEKQECRNPTDRNFLISYGVFVVLLMPCLIYNLANSNIRLITTPMDGCGNFCGHENPKNEWECSGQNMTHKKYLKWTDHYKSFCVEDCGKNYTANSFGICKLDSNSDQKPHEDMATKLSLFIFKIILSSLITIGVNVGVICIFRCSADCVLWTIIIGVFILGSIALCYIWWVYLLEDVDEDIAGLMWCLVATAVITVLIAVLIYHRKRIRLVILLMKEVSKAIFAIPAMLFEPVIIFLAQMVIISLFFITTIYLATAAQPVKVHNRVTFEVTDGVVATKVYNTVLTMWSLCFVEGLQYMVVGGAVSEWYFASDNTILDKSMRRSFSVLCRFHLGTLAFGSLIMIPAQIFRITIKLFFKIKFIRLLANYCLSSVYELLNCITKRAYILTAIHGQPFCKSSKRATQLLASNIIDELPLKCMVNLTLDVLTVLTSLFSSLVPTILILLGDTDEKYVTLAIVYLLSLFAGGTFVSLYQITIDTVFLCYCEDKLLNHGVATAYALSKELLDFIDAQKGITQKDAYNQLYHPTPVVV